MLFGQLTDRFGRKKLFLITLGVYIVATVLTAFSMTPLWYFGARFLTGMGIGGEYAAINSAIDELIPAKHRGRVDVAINGSFWIGAAAGALLTIPLLDPTVVDPAWGWRLAFGLGAILAVGVLIVRRHVPESPRWLFIHGREDEGEEIVQSIEHTVEEETGQALDSVDETITIRQRKTIGIGEIARTVFTLYPRRTLVCFALFVGQAFLYNAFFFTYGDTLTTFLGVKQTGWYIAVFAVSNFAGALLLSRLFDTVGRVRMIAGTYIVSGVLLAGTGIFLGSVTARDPHADGRDHLLLRLGRRERGVPHRQRGLPDGDPGAVHRVLLRRSVRRRAASPGRCSSAGSSTTRPRAATSPKIAIGYFVGAALMIVGGVIQAFLGVKAEGKSLESIAQPLTAEEADAESPGAETPRASARDVPPQRVARSRTSEWPPGSAAW